MDRLAWNLDDLRRLVRELTAKGVRVQFVQEQLTFTGDDTAMANLLLSVMGRLRGVREAARPWPASAAQPGDGVPVPAQRFLIVPGVGTRPPQDVFPSRARRPLPHVLRWSQGRSSSGR